MKPQALSGMSDKFLKDLGVDPKNIKNTDALIFEVMALW
jgi:uncharacterized protein YjiS (DUF1127 family)